MRYFKFFLALFMAPISLNLYAQKITGAVTDEEGKPFQNYTLKVVGASKADTLQVYSPDGRFAFEGRDCPYRFMIEYFGESVLDTVVGCNELKYPLAFRARRIKKLEEVVIRGRRPIVKSRLMEDQIQVNGISIFENNNMVEVLQKVPGFIRRSDQCTYKSLPVVAVRFEEHGMSRPLTREMSRMLESYFAEDVASVKLKRLPQGNGYELIVNSVTVKGFENTTSAEYARGKGNHGNVNTRTVLNTEKFANRLFLSTRPSSAPTSSAKRYVFEDGTKKDINDDLHKKSNNFSCDYSNNYKFSDAVNAGLLVYYFTTNDKKDRTSNVFGDISDRAASQYNNYLTTGVYFDLNKKRHQLHVEMAFNSVRDRYKLKNPMRELLQSTKNSKMAPNASADYTYTFKNPKFKFRSVSVYSYLFLESEDLSRGVKFDDFWEHSFKQDLYLNGGWGNFEFNAGVSLDCTNNPNAHSFYADPHILLGYNLQGHRFNLRLDQKNMKPLSVYLGGTSKQQNDGVEITGNSRLKPVRYTELVFSYSKGNFGADIGGYRRKDAWMMLPSYQDNKFVYRQVNIGTAYMFTSYIYYSQYWKHFYISPYILFETGRFKTSETHVRCDNRYLSMSLPFGLNFRQHKIGVVLDYQPIVRYETEKKEPMSNVSLKYTFTTQNKALRISVFANDIFNQNQIQSRMYADGFNVYGESITDSRRVGIQIVYRFTPRKNIRGFGALRHNVSRN